MDMRNPVIYFDSNCNVISSNAFEVHSPPLSIRMDCTWWSGKLFLIWMICKVNFTKAWLRQFQGSINEHHEVSKQPRQRLYRATYVLLYSCQECRDFILYFTYGQLFHDQFPGDTCMAHKIFLIRERFYVNIMSSRVVKNVSDHSKTLMACQRENNQNF